MEEPKRKGKFFKLADRIVASRMLYVLLGVSFILYIFTKSPFFALLVALSIAGEFVAETISGAGKHGWFHELKEIGIAVIIALVVWFGGGYLLNTPAPLNAVVSCSMLPALERGDMMILQGSLPNAPEVSVSPEQWNSPEWAFDAGWCGLCKKNGSNHYESCQGAPIRMIEERGAGGNLISYGVEVAESESGARDVSVSCGWCEVELDSGGIAKTPCAKSITLGGTTITEDLSNDVIVYTAGRGDVMQGEIIHRVFARVNVGGEYYFITKGDNNPQFDFQYGNAPAPEDRVAGKTIFRIPYLGYVKLFLFGYLSTPQGCDARILHQS